MTSPETYRVWFRCTCGANQWGDVEAETAEDAIKLAQHMRTWPWRNRESKRRHRTIDPHSPEWRLDTWYLVDSEASGL